MFKKTLLLASMALMVTGSQAAALLASNTTFGSFDASSGLRTFSIGSSGAITDVNLQINFSKCDDPAPGVAATSCVSSGEEFAGETYFYLVSPTGTRVDLVWTYSSVPEGVAGGSTKSNGTYDLNVSSGGVYNVTFDDQAGSGVGPLLASGTFRPEELLSLFNGEDALGTWTLGLGDSVGADPLTFFSSDLSIQTRSDVPEPASLSLLGLGLIGLAAARRRKA